MCWHECCEPEAAALLRLIKIYCFDFGGGREEGRDGRCIFDKRPPENGKLTDWMAVTLPVTFFLHLSSE